VILAGGSLLHDKMQKHANESVEKVAQIDGRRSTPINADRRQTTIGVHPQPEIVFHQPQMRDNW